MVHESRLMAHGQGAGPAPGARGRAGSGPRTGTAARAPGAGRASLALSAMSHESLTSNNQLIGARIEEFQIIW